LAKAESPGDCVGLASAHPEARDFRTSFTFAGALA
jgi:hypothetical protein